MWFIEPTKGDTVTRLVHLGKAPDNKCKIPAEQYNYKFVVMLMFCGHSICSFLDSRSLSIPRVNTLQHADAKYLDLLVFFPSHSIASWWLNQPLLRNISQIGFIFPNFRGENKQSLKPPPR